MQGDNVTLPLSKLVGRQWRQKTMFVSPDEVLHGKTLGINRQLPRDCMFSAVDEEVHSGFDFARGLSQILNGDF
jgi:hypothetical protein